MTQDPKLPPLSLRQVSHVVTLAHHLSFTMAAEELGITQPALSASIRQIEDLLGGKVFARSPHKVELTAAGADLLPSCEFLLNSAAMAIRDMQNALSARARIVEVGIVPSVAGRVLPILKDLRDGRPRLRIEIRDLSNVDLAEAIRRGRVDFGVGIEDAASLAAGFEHVPLLKDELVALLAADDPQAARQSLPWSDLGGRDLALFLRGNLSDLAESTAHRAGVKLNIVYRVEHTEPLYGLVRAGLATAILSRLYAESLHDPAIRVIPLLDPLAERQVCLLRTHRVTRSAEVRRCFEMLRARMSIGPFPQGVGA